MAPTRALRETLFLRRDFTPAERSRCVHDLRKRITVFRKSPTKRPA